MLLWQPQQPLPGTRDAEVMAELLRCRGSSKERRQPRPPQEDLDDPAPDEIEPAWAGSEGIMDLEGSQAADLERTTAKQGVLAEAPDSQASPYIWEPKNWTDFCMVICDERGTQTCAKLGHQGTLVIDSTFGTNCHKLPLFTLLVVDEHGHGHPVAFMLCSSESAELVAKFLRAVSKKVCPPPPPLLARHFDDSVHHSRKLMPMCT